MIRSAVLSLVAAFAMAACAQAQAPAFDPALYVVRDADSAIYLYGAVHVRPAGSDWGDADVRAALAESDEIWTELIISPEGEAEAAALFQRLGRAPPDRPLSSWLSEEENARLNATAARVGVPRGALEQMQPWFASLMLSLTPILRAGYDPDSGVDRAVDAFGDANGKTMRAFETNEFQLGMLAGLSPELQREMLLEAIDEADQGVPLFQEMTRAWERGDLQALEAAVIEDTRDNYPELYQALFVQRNNAWMAVLLREMEGSGVDFVAVGAGHLIGAEGLIEQFRARGYTVERVGGAN